MIIRQMLNNPSEWCRELHYSFVYQFSTKPNCTILQFGFDRWKTVTYTKDRMLDSPTEWTEFIYNDEVTDGI